MTISHKSPLITWRPPTPWHRISTIDVYTGGEPFRIIVEGLPEIPGRTVLEKRRYFRDHYDHLRTGLMFEPRGHVDMYGAIISSSPDADLDVFFTGVEPDVKVATDEALAVAQRLATEAVSKNRSNLAKGS